LFVEVPSGAVLGGAWRFPAKAPQGSVILAMLPDTGERYLSTALFEGVPEGSDPEPALP
jgi:cysteine synthase